MVTFPTYEAKRNIQATPLAPMRNEVDAQFENTQKVVGAVQKVTQMFSDAHDVMQATEKKKIWETGSAKIDSDAALDNASEIDKVTGKPVFKNNAAIYKQRYAELKKNALSGISNAQISNKLAAEMDTAEQVAGIKIDSEFTKKYMKQNEENIPDVILPLVQKSIFGIGSEKEQALDEINTYLNSQVNSGLIDAGKARTYLNNARKGVVEWAIQADPATEEPTPGSPATGNQSKVLEQIRDPEGAYKFLSPADRLDMIAKSQTRIKMNNETLKSEMTEESRAATDKLIVDVVNRQVSLTRFDAELIKDPTKGGISRATLKSLREGYIKENEAVIKAIKTGAEKEKPDVQDVKANEFLTAFDKFIADPTTLDHAYEILAKSYADNNLDSNELAMLTEIKKKCTDIEFLRKNVGPMKDFHANARNLTNATEKDIADGLKKLIMTVSEGKNVDEMYTKLMNLQQEADVRNIAKGEYPPNTRSRQYSRKHGKMMWFKMNPTTKLFEIDPNQKEEPPPVKAKPKPAFTPTTSFLPKG